MDGKRLYGRRKAGRKEDCRMERGRLDGRVKLYGRR
jgi:hypothetical protein